MSKDEQMQASARRFNETRHPPSKRAARAWITVALLAAAVVAPGCASQSANLGAAKARKETVDRVSYWAGDGVKGEPRIVINLSDQRAYFYKGKQLVGVSL